MMSVTTLRNIKKLLSQFLYEKLQRNKEAIDYEREEVMERLKRHVERKFKDKFKFEPLSVVVDEHGTVIVTFVPPYPEVTELERLNNLEDEFNEQFQKDVTLVERYFTLAEASNVLNIPEMPPRVKEILDEMITSLR